MDIHNSIDGKGLKATNFADGTADTDLATVGQLGGGFPVIFEGNVNSYTVWNQSSTNTSLNATLNKTTLFTSRYTNNCSYISDGTNDVVQITEIGYFRVVFTGSYIFNALYSSSGLYSFNLRPYLLDTTSKAVIVPSTDELFDIRRYFGTTNTNAVYITESFSMERIYYNPSGTLNVGAYMYCSISTVKAATRSFFISHPRLIVTRVF